MLIIFRNPLLSKKIEYNGLIFGKASIFGPGCQFYIQVFTKLDVLRFQYAWLWHLYNLNCFIQLLDLIGCVLDWFPVPYLVLVENHVPYWYHVFLMRYPHAVDFRWFVADEKANMCLSVKFLAFIPITRVAFWLYQHIRFTSVCFQVLKEGKTQGISYRASVVRIDVGDCSAR